MNSGIANYIVSLIDGLPFIDKIAGVVTPITRKADDVTKVFPVACGVQHRDCVAGKYDDLVPNSKYKSIIYFEDNGVSFGAIKGNRREFTSRLRLIGWLNLQKLGETDCMKSEAIILEILRSLPLFPVNHNNYILLMVTLVSEAPKNKDIFSKYSYDEATMQYLMSPYDYFALDINMKWFMNLNCIDPYEPQPSIDCPKQPQ